MAHASFIDRLSLKLEAGHGGAGCLSFRREKFIPKGGPDGGDGGRGAHILFEVNSSLASLSHLYSRREIKASVGQPGSSTKKSGLDGKDVIIFVPIGTIIKDSQGRVIKELLKNSEQFLFLKGGKGGKGNAFFKSSTNQTPRYTQRGLPGQKSEVILEMLLIADLGLVGFPNAGKSTFLKYFTKATPKIANYPFTTLTAQLGIFYFDIHSSFVIADIPGILKGASKGVGLGLDFLKHIQKTRFLFFIVSLEEKEWYPNFLTLRRELEAYDKSMLKKPFFIGLSKRDQVLDEEINTIVEKFPKELREIIIPFSCHENRGIREIKQMFSSFILKRPQSLEEAESHNHE